MLLELKVSNFAIIDSIHVEYEPGLNILSGETGAGKSVLLKSLGLMMGQKGSSDIVKSGAKSATIEGLFEISERKDIQKGLEARGIESNDNNLIVRRVISENGKNKVYLNGNLCTLTDLRDIVAPLIEVTGHNAPLIEMTSQHENKNLQSRAYQLDLVDDYASSWNLRNEIALLYEQYKKIGAEIQAIEDGSRNRQQRLDFLTYQRDEIQLLNLSPGQELELEDHVNRMRNSKHLGEFASEAEFSLYTSDDSATSIIHQTIQRASELAKWDSGLSEKVEPLTQAKTIIEECAFELRKYTEGLSQSPQELEDKEQQLSRLRKMQRKYGQSIEEIYETLGEVEVEIETLENSEGRLKELKQNFKLVSKKLNILANDIHSRRVSAINLLVGGVNDELLDLNMKGVEFEIEISRSEEIGPTGNTEIEFMVRSSKGEKPRSLAKVASGGELSRILLSLKRIIGQSGKPRTYLFDEVDAGVSGPTAEKVGRKLKSIAAGQQVLCVTHLPQVAAFADTHFSIQKTVKDSKPVMSVVRLTKKLRVNEIARLISGEEISTTSLKHAANLIDTAT